MKRINTTTRDLNKIIYILNEVGEINITKFRDEFGLDIRKAKIGLLWLIRYDFVKMRINNSGVKIYSLKGGKRNI